MTAENTFFDMDEFDDGGICIGSDEEGDFIGAASSSSASEPAHHRQQMDHGSEKEEGCSSDEDLDGDSDCTCKKPGQDSAAAAAHSNACHVPCDNQYPPPHYNLHLYCTEARFGDSEDFDKEVMEKMFCERPIFLPPEYCQEQQMRAGRTYTTRQRTLHLQAIHHHQQQQLQQQCLIQALSHEKDGRSNHDEDDDDDEDGCDSEWDPSNEDGEYAIQDEGGEEEEDGSLSSPLSLQSSPGHNGGSSTTKTQRTAMQRRLSARKSGPNSIKKANRAHVSIEPSDKGDSNSNNNKNKTNIQKAPRRKKKKSSYR